VGRFFITIPPKIAVFLFALVAPVSRVASHAVFRMVLFPMYLAYKPLKLRVQKILLPVKNSLWTAFFTRYLVHGFIAILILFVTTQNIFAKGDQNLFEGSSVIAQIFGGQDENTTVRDETAASTDQSTQQNAITSAALAPDLSVDQSDSSQSTDVGGAQPSQNSAAAVLAPSTSNEQTAETRTSTEEYAVQEGDTVSIIASKFGISTNTVLWANNLNDRSLIRPGDKLTILPVSGVLHKVQKGDTVAKIAGRYSAVPDQIVEFNRLVDENDLDTGETLIVPNGEAPEEPKPVPSPKKSSGLAFRIPNIFNPPPPVKVAPSSRMFWPSAYHKINQYFRGWLHTGLDIDCNYGMAIYAAKSGVVTQSGWARGYGNSVTINHGDGISTLYGHHQKNLVRVGQRVDKGQAVGMCGSTGRSTGTHVHFEVRIGGTKVNPLKYL